MIVLDLHPQDVTTTLFNGLVLPEYATRFNRPFELVDGVYRVTMVDGDRLSWKE